MAKSIFSEIFSRLPSIVQNLDSKRSKALWIIQDRSLGDSVSVTQIFYLDATIERRLFALGAIWARKRRQFDTFDTIFAFNLQSVLIETQAVHLKSSNSEIFWSTFSGRGWIL